MTATVTRMPARAEMRARRSAAKHAGRIAIAKTPQAVVTAATDEVKAFLANNGDAAAAQVAAEVAAALRDIMDRANAQVRARPSRYVA